MRILICEDDPIHTMGLEMTFEEAGHEVVGIFSRADEAILQCWRQPPDLAVVDLNLADGPTGLSMVRTLDKMGIPTIVVSGDVDRVARDAPSHALVAKPYRDSQILNAVDAVGTLRAA